MHLEEVLCPHVFLRCGAPGQTPRRIKFTVGLTDTFTHLTNRARNHETKHFGAQQEDGSGRNDASACLNNQELQQVCWESYMNPQSRELQTL